MLNSEENSKRKVHIQMAKSKARTTNIIIKSAWAHRCAEIWDECEIHCALMTHA